MKRISVVFLLVISFFNLLDAAQLNVRNYGATGNGTTNDAPAIQSAINAAQSGDTIYFPNGTYLLNSTLTLPVQRNLQGESKAGTILKGNHSGNMIEGISNTHVNGNQSIYNFTLDGNHKTQSIYFLGRDNLTFYNLTVTHMEIQWNGAIQIVSSWTGVSRTNPVTFYITGITIHDCTFSDNNNGSIGLIGIDGANIYNNTHSENNGSVGTGITCQAMGWLKNIKIHDSTFIGWWANIELMNLLDGNEIYGCTFYGWLSLVTDAYLMSAPSTGYGISVHDNKFSYTGANQMTYAFEIGTNYALCYNNYFENYPEGAIDMWEYSTHNNITIRNNIFYNLQWHAILVGVPSGFNTFKVYNNVFHSNKGSTPALRMRFASGGTLSNADIKNNIFYKFSFIF